jgi:hypothetical protein
MQKLVCIIGAHFQKSTSDNLTKLKLHSRYLLLYLTSINTVIVVGYIFSGNNLFGLLYSMCYFAEYRLYYIKWMT